MGIWFPFTLPFIVNKQHGYVWWVSGERSWVASRGCFVDGGTSAAAIWWVEREVWSERDGYGTGPESPYAVLRDAARPNMPPCPPVGAALLTCHVRCVRLGAGALGGWGGGGAALMTYEGGSGA